MRIKDMLDTKTIPPPHSPPYTDLIGVIKWGCFHFFTLWNWSNFFYFTGHKNIKGRFLYPATLPVTDMMGNYKIGDVMLHLIHSKPHVPENLTDDCKSLKPSINTMP